MYYVDSQLSNGISKADERYAVPRTALFVHAAGIAAQAALKRRSLPVPLLKSIAANVLWDWNHLLRDDETFRRPGDLRWTPRHGGATMEIFPARDDDYECVLEDGAFIDFADFLSSRDFNIVPNTKLHRRSFSIAFADELPKQTVLEQHVNSREVATWTELATMYARCSDEARAALASCRNSHATLLSLAAEVAHWCVHMKLYVDSLISHYKSRSPIATANYALARPALKNIPLREAQLTNVSKNVAEAHRGAFDLKTAGAKRAPIITEVAEGLDLRKSHINILRSTVFGVVSAADILFGEMQHVYFDGRRPDWHLVQDAVTSLSSFRWLHVRERTMGPWLNALAAPTARQAAEACSSLISRIGEMVEKEVGVVVSRLPTFYEHATGSHGPAANAWRSVPRLA